MRSDAERGRSDVCGLRSRNGDLAPLGYEELPERVRGVESACVAVDGASWGSLRCVGVRLRDAMLGSLRNGRWVRDERLGPVDQYDGNNARRERLASARVGRHGYKMKICSVEVDVGIECAPEDKFGMRGMEEGKQNGRRGRRWLLLGFGDAVQRVTSPRDWAERPEALVWLLSAMFPAKSQDPTEHHTRTARGDFWGERGAGPSPHPAAHERRSE